MGPEPNITDTFGRFSQKSVRFLDTRPGLKDSAYRAVRLTIPYVHVVIPFKGNIFLGAMSDTVINSIITLQG